MNTNGNEYDLAIIGGGTAGLTAAFVADSLGARVALIEKNKIGGECLWTGCVPSKTLIQSARVYDFVKRGEEFGIHVENPRVRWNAVQLRIAAIRDEIKTLERAQLAASKIEFVQGTARFEDASTLRVEGKDARTIRAKKFILACGTKPRIPENIGLDEIGALTHEQLFEIKSLPRSLAIVGGGPIGVEMAQAFSRLGCKVTLLQSASTLLPKEDEEISTFCAKILRSEGVEIFCGAKIICAWSQDEKKFLEFWVNGELKAINTSKVLIAAGKRCELAELNIGAAGVQWDERGVMANKYLQTAPNVWACGDVTGEFRFTHVAEAQGKIAAQNALLPLKKKWDARIVPWCTFLDPEVARVGLTEEEARREYSDVRVYREEFSKLDRAIIEGAGTGFLKIVTTGSGRVLGAHIIGPSAGELIHQWVHAVRDGMLISEFAETIHVYPTLSEISHRAGNGYFQDLLKNRWVKMALKKFIR